MLDYICLIKKNFNDNIFYIYLPIVVKYYLTESIAIFGEGILFDLSLLFTLTFQINKKIIFPLCAHHLYRKQNDYWDIND